MNALLALAVALMTTMPAAPAPFVAWMPLGYERVPGQDKPVLREVTSQALALMFADQRCHHILLDGSRGWGKTEIQLAASRRNVGRGYGAHWRGIIFDREYKALDDLVAKSKRFFRLFGDGARFLESKGEYKWVWPTGEELLFRVVKKASDYEKYHGHEYPFIGWNELTKYPTSELYDSLMSCNRSSFLPAEHSPIDPKTGERRVLPEIPLIVVSTTNPSGPGHSWVKRRFVDVAPSGRVVRTTVEVFNPRTKQLETVTKTQVRIFGSYRENRYLSPEYIADLVKITDPAKRKAWLLGDWNIPCGDMFEGVWGDHLFVPRFQVPAAWHVDRSLDHGSARPFSIGWWAESNGEAATMPDGTEWCPPAGTLVRIAEWYGCTEIGQNKGIRLSARRIAEGILERERELSRVWLGGRSVSPGPADNSIDAASDSETDTIKKVMSDNGVEWTRSDKSPGSRKMGWQLIRERMEAARTGEGPALFLTENCTAARTILGSAPRDPDDADDIDTDSEDHLPDELRYRVLAGSNRDATSIRFNFPT